MPLEGIKILVKTLLGNGKIHDALQLYTVPYGQEFHRLECLEVFVDGIAEIAREKLKENKKFNFDSFLCTKCNDIIKDPVTLKCGHTLSKQCVLSEAKNESFACPKCGKNYSFTYISQLKNSVTILSLVEKLYERLLSYKNNPDEDQINAMYDGQKYLISCENDDLILDIHINTPAYMLHASTSAGYFKKGNILYNLGNYKESFKALLTCYSINPNALHAKFLAIEVFRLLLRNFPCSLSCCPNSISIGNTNLLKRNSLNHTESNLRSSGSSDSLHVAEDDRSSSDEDEVKEISYSNRRDLHLMLDIFFDSIEKLKEEKSILSRIDVKCLDKKEFECPLCMRILWEPVTTTCGHTFCRVCLNRCFDHQPTCPLCKASLTSFLAERVQNTTEFLELAIKILFPTEYAERQASFMEEMEELTNAGIDPEHEIPLFVCTVALPTVPCPLHVFEPRYRLMIRQCMESGSKQFGMCGVVDDEIAEYGTMLEIRDVQYFPDGRSIVDTVGRKRFKILRRGERDGYHTGAVEFLEDQPLNVSDLQCIQEKHDRTYRISNVWFMQLPADTRHQILQHFGPMPRVETDYVSSPDGPSWLWWMLAILPVETRLKVLLVSLTSLRQRLEFLYRILLHFQSAIMS